MELFTATSPQTISRQQSSLGSKLISPNVHTYDFYLRELLRSELTYLLTYYYYHYHYHYCFCFLFN